MRQSIWRPAFLAIGLALCATPIAAQQPPSARAAPSRPAAQALPANVPRVEVLVELIRGSLLALHQANVTGNYTVLRDLGAPAFQQANSAARLAVVFAPLRDQRLDLGPALRLTPELSEPPAIANGRLVMVGRFTYPDKHLAFELQFENVQGAWRIYGISVNALPLQTAAREPTPIQRQPAPADPLPVPTRIELRR